MQRSAVSSDSASSPGLLRLARQVRSAAGCSALQPRAALHVLDWLACAAQGSGSEQGRIFERWLVRQAAGTVPTLAGRRSDAAAAAAYHGALGSALEMDDVHRSSILHPGPVVVPAVLAAAGARAASDADGDTPSGATLLSAVLGGYEAMIRVGRTLGPAHYAHWHTSGTAGAFGAAAGAALALGLDDEQLAQAMALAGTRAGGLWQLRHERVLAKCWHMAGAARDGLAAAQLAASGLTGPLAVIEGPSGWLAATGDPSRAALLDEPRAAPQGGDPGFEPWLADVSFKPWPACRHAHPALDALSQLLQRHTLSSGDIRSIDVFGYADLLRFCDRPVPTTENEARFSIQHALAARIVWGEPLLEHYRGAALGDPAVASLRERVHAAVDAAIDARFPAQYGARVLVTLRDGARRVCEVADTLGDPARPLSTAALRAKAGMLFEAAGWPATRIEAAFAACTSLPEAASLEALHQVICP